MSNTKEKNKQNLEWYHRNKDWCNWKRNEIRRERYKTDPIYRLKRLNQKKPK